MKNKIARDCRYYLLMVFILYFGLVALEVVGSYSILFNENTYSTEVIKKIIKPIVFVSLVVSCSIIPLIVIFINKRFYIPIIFLVIFSLFSLANLLHVRVFSMIISPSMYTNIENLRGLTGSIMGLLNAYDILYLIIPILVIIMYCFIKPRIEIVSFKKRLLAGILICCISTLFVMGYIHYLSKIETNFEHLSGKKWLLQCHKMETKGFYSYYGCINSYLATAADNYASGQHNYTEKDKIEIESYITSITPIVLPERKKPESVKKNLIILLIESFNSKVLTGNIKGQSIMPNVTRLMNEPQTLISRKIKHPEQTGMSIAGQFNILTGLIALNDGIFTYDCPWNVYPSIIKAMKKKHGNLSSTVLVPTNKNFWGQTILDNAVESDSTFGKEEMGLREEMQSDKWINDQRLLQFATTKLQQKKDTPFYLLVVTGDMHNPYVEIPECELVFPDDYPEKLKAYYSRSYNTDKYIGEFINSLKGLDGGRIYEESLIVIVADHNIPMAYIQGIPINEDIKDDQALSCYTPAIFLNTGYDMRQTNQNIEAYEFVQQQIYPTMLTLLELSAVNKYSGLFPSILDTEQWNKWDFSDVSRTSPNQKLRETFRISDLIIKSNYFGVNYH